MRLPVLLFMVLLTAAGPAHSADWSGWKKNMPINLGRVDAETIGLVPVDTMITLKADEMSNSKNPLRELRLVYKKGDSTKEVPFQLSRVSVWNRDTSPSVRTFNGQITFFPLQGDQAGTYQLLYANPDAKATTYTTDLVVSGKGPHWTIENSLIKAQLRAGDKAKSKRVHDYFGDSGQLGTVTIKSRPGAVVTNSHQVIHWEPGVNIPKRGWVHAYAWDPPAEFEIEKGPIFVEVRRRGPLPKIPEIQLSVTYRFFKERSFVEVGTRIDILKNIGVASIRNNCCVFDESLFTRMAWEQFGEVRDELINKYKPVNKHGDILRLKPDTPWFAVYHPDTKVGVATVYLDESNVGPFGGPPAQFDHALYFTHNTIDHMSYWFRTQLYFVFDWDRKQLFTVPRGQVYAEQNYYYFYDIEKTGPIDGVRKLSRAAANKPDVKVGPYPFAPPQ